MKKIILVFYASIVFLVLFGCCNKLVSKIENEKSVVINEVCANGKTIIKDEAFETCDYIELYNHSLEEVVLKGWHLSDDPENLTKYCIGDISLRPSEYAVFFSAKEGEYDADRINFNISSNGEKIFLADSQGKVIDTIYVPQTKVDTVYGRIGDGQSEWAKMEASVGGTNDDAKITPEILLDMPVFSHNSGFYKEEFVLTIHANEKETIYYTTDGSVPTENSKIYTEGIKIQNATGQKNLINQEKRVVCDWVDYEPNQENVAKGTVIRAVVMDEQGACSEVVTETYFVGLEQFEDRDVIAVVAEPEKLFGAEGIFVTGKAYDELYLNHESSTDSAYEFGWLDNFDKANFFKRGRAHEITSNIQWFSDGNEQMNQIAGLRTHGNYSRLYPQKSIQLIARTDYSGTEYFEAEWFEEIKSHSVLFTTSPNKVYYLKFADGLGFDHQQVRKSCPVFLNGEYWYDAFIMEKYDEMFFEEHYGVSAENIIMIKDEEIEIGEQYQSVFDELMHYVSSEEVSVKEKLEWIYSNIDVQSFIDWLCFNLYLCNDDVHFMQNSLYWRTLEDDGSEYGDGKWRWLLYDIDHAVTVKGAESETFSDLLLLRFNYLYKVLKEDEAFRAQFAKSFMDIANTAFKPENAEKILSEHGLDLTHGNEFFLKRFDYAAKSLEEELELHGTVETVTITSSESSGGKITINSTELGEMSETWEGRYFTDYPVRIKAVANPGYQFAGWRGNLESKENEIEVEIPAGGVYLEAIFEKEP